MRLRVEERSVVVVAHIDVGAVGVAVGEGRSVVFGLGEGNSFGGSRWVVVRSVVVLWSVRLCLLMRA